MKNIILASTFHDADARLLDAIDTTVNFVLSHCEGWVISATNETHPGVLNQLRSLGVSVHHADPSHSLVPDKIENNHLNALVQAYEVARQKEAPLIQYTDGDRVIMAATYYPQDFDEAFSNTQEIIAANGMTKFYMALCRDAKAYLAHHDPLKRTEFEFNRLYTQAFGVPLDMGSTGHIMSIDVTEEIIQRSPQVETVSFPHPKWLIIAREMGAQIHSQLTKNILTFETPMQFRQEIKQELLKPGRTFFRTIHSGGKNYRPATIDDLNDYEVVQQIYAATLGVEGPFSVSSPVEWKRRFTLANQYISILKSHLSTCISDKKNEAAIKSEIERSLDRLQGLEAKIIDKLEHPLVDRAQLPFDQVAESSVERLRKE